MRSVTFRDLFNRVVRMHGRDPRKEVSPDMREALVEHVNERVRIICKGWRWPEWELTEERAFRQVWNSTNQYLRANLVDGRPDEVFYITDLTYYRVLDDAIADPPVGTLPTSTTYFEEISPVDTFLAYDQGCKRSIGIVRGIYSQNPRIPTGSRNGLLCYMPSERGVDIHCAGTPTVFVTYTMPVPRYTMIPYVAGKTYARGSMVFDPTTGECFQAVAATSAVPSNVSFWRWIPFLEVWEPYVAKGSFADSLLEFDQGGNTEVQAKMVLAQAADTKANDLLQLEVDSLTVQGQVLQWNFCRPHACWCESEPWTGGTVTELTDDCEDELGWIYPAQPTVPTEELGEEIRGITPLVSGQEYVDVTFAAAMSSSNWVLVECSIVNTTDSTPLNIWAGILTVRSTTGFRLQLNGIPNSGNYFLHWAIREVISSGELAPTYTLTGPVSGVLGAAAAFTVSLPLDTVVTATVIVTPSDGGDGGTFLPTSVELTTEEPAAGFTYTPASYGGKSISVTNSAGLTNPDNKSFISTAATYTLSGPTSGEVDVESTDFTVELPSGGVVVGTMIVTPDDGSDGAFTPVTVSLTTAAPVDTFTYTPASPGEKTITVNNNRSLTDPPDLTYESITIISPPDIAGLELWLKADSLVLSDNDDVNAWVDQSGNGYNLLALGAGNEPTYKTNILNSLPVVRFDGVANYLTRLVDIGVPQPNTIFVVGKQPSTATRCAFLWSSSTPQVIVVEITTGHFGIYAGSEIQDSGNHSGAFHVFSAVISGGNGTGYVDGTLTIASAACGSNPVGQVALMFDSTSTYFPGDIAELIIYNTALSGTDRHNVEVYLGNKYGITVA